MCTCAHGTTELTTYGYSDSALSSLYVFFCPFLCAGMRCVSSLGTLGSARFEWSDGENADEQQEKEGKLCVGQRILLVFCSAQGWQGR